MMAAILTLDALGPGRRILKNVHSFVDGQTVEKNTVPYFPQILTNISLNLCNNRDQTYFFHTLTFARPLGRC